MSPLLRLACLGTVALSVASVAGAETIYVDSVLTTPTVYLAPTSSVVRTVDVVPTVYTPTSLYATSYAPVYDLAPTAYYTPTAYFTPTVYNIAPTAYYTPTAFVETVGVARRYRRGLFGRTRVIDYAVEPTTYVLPTSMSYVPTSAVLGSPVVATSMLASPVIETSATLCGEPARVVTGLVTAAPAPTAGGRAAGPAAAAPERRSEPVVVSVPKDGGEPPLNERPAPPQRVDQGRAPARPEPVAQPEPAAPAPAPAVAPAQRAADSPPPAQDPVPPLPNELGDQPAAPRIVQKPVPPTFGLLRGEVLSGFKHPEQGVKIRVSSRTDPEQFKARTAETDVGGFFALYIPPGDWSIQVATLAGRFEKVQDIVVMGGEVTTEEGRPVPILTINR